MGIEKSITVLASTISILSEAEASSSMDLSLDQSIVSNSYHSVTYPISTHSNAFVEAVKCLFSLRDSTK
jgi:hypothetical protein